MKVIGKSKDGWDQEYICTVSHTELEKFMNLYYDKMKKLDVGSVVDLGAGHDHASEIRVAFGKLQDLAKSHAQVFTALGSGLNLVKIMDLIEVTPAQTKGSES